jgi:hypothetical protein
MDIVVVVVVVVVVAAAGCHRARATTVPGHH